MSSTNEVVAYCSNEKIIDLFLSTLDTKNAMVLTLYLYLAKNRV